jgi:hypothetical protein
MAVCVTASGICARGKNVKKKYNNVKRAKEEKEGTK